VCPACLASAGAVVLTAASAGGALALVAQRLAAGLRRSQAEPINTNINLENVE
jgi:hypothetical protein